MRLALIAVLLLAPAAASASSALVVVGDPNSSSYLEALDGFRDELGESVEIVSAGRPLPPGPHGVIVAFGGRAALRASKAGAPLVVALAPAYRGADSSSMTVHVAMTPAPERFAGFLSVAGVRRLLAVRASTARAAFVRRAAEAGHPFGLEIEDGVLSGVEDLPRLLRGADPRVDAIWLAPDPTVVTPEVFAAVREFSRARAIPFFAPAAGLVSGEVRGELTVSFRDCGREAARAAREMLAGRPVAALIYPARPQRVAPIVKSTIPAVSP